MAVFKTVKVHRDFAVEVGSSSRDLPLAGGIHLDVPKLKPRLHDESTIEEWLADTEAFEALQDRVQGRGGTALDIPPGLLAVVGGQPLRRFVKFPGSPVTVEDVDAVLARYGR